MAFPSFLVLAVYFQLSLLKWVVGGVGHGRGGMSGAWEEWRVWVGKVWERWVWMDK